MAGLADKRKDCAVFDTFGFGGYTLTGASLHAALEEITDATLKVTALPWGLLKLGAPFSPLLREVLEMRYLWDTPHSIDDAKLREFLPDFVATPLKDALKDALVDRLMPTERQPSCPVAKARA